MNLLFQINSEVTHLEQPILTMRVGKEHFCFCVCNKPATQIKLLKYYAIDDWNKKVWHEILQENEILKETFYEILLSYDFKEGLLIPLSLYNDDHSEQYLFSAFGYLEESAVIAENISGWQLQNVYAVPEEIFECLKKQFPAARFWHQYTTVIKNKDITSNAKKLVIDFRKKDFIVVVFSRHELLLARSFDYTTAADVVFHLLQICNEFSFSQEKVQLNLSGLIDSESNLCKELQQYFLHIEFRNVSWKTDNSYPAHFFTALNDLVQCVS